MVWWDHFHNWGIQSRCLNWSRIIYLFIVKKTSIFGSTVRFECNSITFKLKELCTPEMPTSLWSRVRVESRVFDLEQSYSSSLWGSRHLESRVFDLESEPSHKTLRVASLWPRVRVESRVFDFESESSHESWLLVAMPWCLLKLLLRYC